MTGDHFVLAAFAVPGGFLAAQILTGKWSGRRGRSLGWALFGVPIVAIGVHSHSWIVFGAGIALLAWPYLVERAFDDVWPRAGEAGDKAGGPSGRSGGRHELEPFTLATYREVVRDRDAPPRG